MSKVVVITSGKGGVGKTTTSANIATGLALQGLKTVAIDFDVGLRNLDLVMGCERRVVYDFVNVIRGEAKLQQALIRDKRIENLYVLPASQTRDKDALDPEGVGRVIDELKQHGLRVHHLRLARRHREGRPDGHVLRRRGDRRDQPGGLVGARLRPRARPARRQDQPRRAGRAARFRPTCC